MYYKNAEIVNILAQQSRVDLDAPDTRGYTPLVYALSGGRYNVGYDSLEHLTASKDLKINDQYRFTDTRFMQIQNPGPKDVEDYHERYHETLGSSNLRSYLRPIHLVALSLDARSMKLLNRHSNLMVTEPTKDGVTALMIATWADRQDYSVAALQRILSHPDNRLDVQDSLMNRTALMHAIIYGLMSLEPVALLIDAGAKLDLQDKKGHTALMLAIAKKTSRRSATKWD